MKKKLALVAVTVVLTAGVWKVTGETGELSSPVDPEINKTVLSNPNSKLSQVLSASGRTLDPLVKEANSAAAAPTSVIDASLVQDLQNYQVIKAKTFLSMQEEAQKKEFLRDRQLLERAGRLLTDISVMLDNEYESNENAAIDVLLEALQSGNQAVAEEVIWTVIRDEQVEDPRIPQKQREVLAGIKGELLYHATATSRFPASAVQSSLPGPVSARIWGNVQEQQQSNLAESNQEVKAHEDKFKKGS